MLVALAEYAKKLGKNPANARQMAGRGSFNTAVKIGRDWLIDPSEPWPDRRVKTGKWRKKEMKIYAQVVKSGKVVKTEQVGSARLDEGRVSARKYDELKRAAMKIFPKLEKGEHLQLVAEDGRVDSFGGYPALSYVVFK